MRAILFLIMAPIFWGLNFHLAKVMLARVSFLEVGFWRYLLGVGAIWLIGRLRGVKWSLPDWKRHSGGLLLVGVIGLFGFNFLFFLGLEYTSALNGALIISFNPALTLVFDSLILKNRILSQQKTGIAIAMAGVLLLITKGAPHKLLEIEWAFGDLLIFGANCVFALYHIWVRQHGKYLSNSVFTFWTNTLCLLCFLSALPFVGLQAVPHGDTAFWSAALGIGVFGTALAYLFWNRGIAETGAGNAGFYMNIVPLAAAVLAVFFGEELYSYHLLSGALIVVGMIWLNYHGKRP